MLKINIYIIVKISNTSERRLGPFRSIGREGLRLSTYGKLKTWKTKAANEVPLFLWPTFPFSKNYAHCALPHSGWELETPLEMHKIEKKVKMFQCCTLSTIIEVCTCLWNQSTSNFKCHRMGPILEIWKFVLLQSSLFQIQKP